MKNWPALIEGVADDSGDILVCLPDEAISLLGVAASDEVGCEIEHDYVLIKKEEVPDD